MKTSIIYLFLLLTIGVSAQQTPVKVPQTNQAIPEKEKTGCVYGDCDNGWGKWQYNNGYYSGFFKEGKRDGYGLYDWKEAGKYIGFWKNDTRSGYGVYFYNEGDEMSGNFENGELNGFGKKYKDKKWEQGVYEGGTLKTKHDFYTNNKDVGCVAGDCDNKYGRYKWANGDVYTGFFKNGNMYMGTYKFANGDKYSGFFDTNNRFSGQGRFFFQDGAYYGGEWLYGKYNGRGYYTSADVVSQKGIWENGQLTKKY